MRHVCSRHVEVHARTLIFKVVHGGTSRIIHVDLSLQRRSALMVVLDVRKVTRSKNTWREAMLLSVEIVLLVKQLMLSTLHGFEAISSSIESLNLRIVRVIVCWLD